MASLNVTGCSNMSTARSLVALASTIEKSGWVSTAFT
jgi:hypothetical protein